MAVLLSACGTMTVLPLLLGPCQNICLRMGPCQYFCLLMGPWLYFRLLIGPWPYFCLFRSPVVECGNRETDGNGEEAAKKDITERKKTIKKKV